MRVSDGQVLDYTKSEHPYMDERFLQPSEVTGSVDKGFSHDVALDKIVIMPEPSVVAESTTQKTLEQQQPLTEKVNSQANSLAHNPYAGLIFGQSVGTFEEGITKVMEKVKARKDALESLDMTSSDEIRIAVKTLDWVLKTIEDSRTTWITTMKNRG